jgi:Protein of unknown function (DUF4239)
MLSYLQSAFFVIGAMATSIVIVAVLNRVWPIPSRKLVNDVTGWQLGILGTTYGVILGFMLFTVWNDFRIAEINTNLEASSLLTVSRIGGTLPSPERESIRALAVKYAEATIHEDWPAMQVQQDSLASERVAQDMWNVLAQLKAGNSEVQSADHLTNALKELSERRNLRGQEFRERLPGILWFLLVAGAGATVGSSCLLGNDNKWLHYWQVLGLTFVVAVTLASIADLARPFEGGVSVTPIAFERALTMMR